MNDIAGMQVPQPGTLNLDHLAHFVPDMDAASAALAELGFTLTPFSPQSQRLQADGPLVPAGTGNRCVMLESGYLEFLTPTGATPVADQLRAAIQRYVGVHLVAFGTADPGSDHARLAKEGFEPSSPVALQRPITTDGGVDTARFTVVRVPPGKMAEGRIQFCRHHTPELLWQRRWTAHRNGAVGLAGVLICVADPAEAAERYSRYTGLPAASETDERHARHARHIRTARGTLSFFDPRALESTLDATAPAVPWIAGYALESRDLAATRDALLRCGITVRELAQDRLVAALPQALGGVVVFLNPRSGPLRFG